MNPTIDEPRDMRPYRQRLYDAYVRSGQAERIESPADLAKRAPYLRHVVARHFPHDRSCHVLDVGCGAGALLYFAREAGYGSLHGVDASPEQVASARRLGLDFVQQGDALETLAAQPAEGLDVIVAFDVLEHLSKEEILAFFDESRRVLAPRGRIIAHMPNAESPFGAAIRYGDFTHETAFTRDSIAQIASAVGFATVECHEDRPVPHGLKSAIRWLAWPVVRGLFRAIGAIETGDLGREAIFSRNLVAVITK